MYCELLSLLLKLILILKIKITRQTKVCGFSSYGGWGSRVYNHKFNPNPSILFRFWQFSERNSTVKFSGHPVYRFLLKVN